MGGTRHWPAWPTRMPWWLVDYLRKSPPRANWAGKEPGERSDELLGSIAEMSSNHSSLTPDHPDSTFLAACRGEPHHHTPVWFMRQAGRSLPEYRAARGTGTILDAVADPDR